MTDAPEPTTPMTVVTGWSTPDDDRPQARYVFALTSADRDGDGNQCWQAPGSDHEFSWARVLEYCAYGRTITE